MRRIVLNFTPSWFSINMGTGIVSILLHQLPYQFRGLGIIANIIFGLNVVLFLLFLLISIARYVIWPRMWPTMLFHPTQSLFLGTFSMGFSTIVNMCALSAAPAWGSGFAALTWALWWINSVIAVAVCIGLPFLQVTRHRQAIDQITGVWFLPVVSTVVTAASGGIVAAVLGDPAHVKVTLVASWIQLGTGLGFAFLLMALYYLRLVSNLHASALIARPAHDAPVPPLQNPLLLRPSTRFLQQRSSYPPFSRWARAVRARSPCLSSRQSSGLFPRRQAKRSDRLRRLQWTKLGLWPLPSMACP